MSGNGWDCHRTWESVLFGSIPVVMYSPTMVDLYHRSPVMVVSNWSQVTRESLLGHQVATTSKDVVFVDYWLEKIDLHSSLFRRGGGKANPTMLTS